MNPDRWDEFMGVPCDDPAERVGDAYPDPPDTDVGLLWEELSPQERAYLSRAAQR